MPFPLRFSAFAPIYVFSISDRGIPDSAQVLHIWFTAALPSIYGPVSFTFWRIEDILRTCRHARRSRCFRADRTNPRCLQGLYHSYLRGKHNGINVFSNEHSGPERLGSGPETAGHVHRLDEHRWSPPSRLRSGRQLDRRSHAGTLRSHPDHHPQG